MTAPLIARFVAAGRIGFGVALIVAPERVTSLWLGSDAGRPGARVVTRGLGARDLALGLSGLARSRRPTLSSNHGWRAPSLPTRSETVKGGLGKLLTQRS